MVVSISIPKDELVVMGARYRANFLVEQAGYTLGIAAKDGQAMNDLLPEGFPNEVKVFVEKVTAALQDAELMKQEAKDATKTQNQAAKDAKIWRRRAVSRSVRGVRLGARMPDGLLSIGRASKIPELQGQIEIMIKLFEENIAKMPGKGADKLLEEGKAIALALRTTDAEQEVKRLRALPDSVQVFYEQKGFLYVALKAINDAGRELYSHDAEAAGRYNLSILNRHAGKRKDETPPIEEKK